MTTMQDTSDNELINFTNLIYPLSIKYNICQIYTQHYDNITIIPHVPVNDSNRRSCRHILCSECFKLLTYKNCPFCRANYNSHVKLDLNDFNLIDYDDDKHVDKSEIVDILRLIYDFEYKQIYNFINACWPTYDTDNNGLLDQNEYQLLIQEVNCNNIKKLNRNFDKKEFKNQNIDQIHFLFSFYDLDSNGSLDIDEIVFMFLNIFYQGLRIDIIKNEYESIKLGIKMIIKDTDDNNNQTVEFEEFLIIFENMFRYNE